MQREIFLSKKFYTRRFQKNVPVVNHMKGNADVLNHWLRSGCISTTVSIRYPKIRLVMPDFLSLFINERTNYPTEHDSLCS